MDVSNRLNKKYHHCNTKICLRAVKKVVSYFVLSGDQVGLHDRNLIGLGGEERKGGNGEEGGVR